VGVLLFTIPVKRHPTSKTSRIFKTNYPNSKSHPLAGFVGVPSAFYRLDSVKLGKLFLTQASPQIPLEKLFQAIIFRLKGN